MRRAVSDRFDPHYGSCESQRIMRSPVCTRLRGAGGFVGAEAVTNGIGMLATAARGGHGRGHMQSIERPTELAWN